MVTITPPAAEQIRTLVPKDEPDKGLRIFIEKGGCSGRQYMMSIDAAKEGDHVIELNGAKVFIDEASYVFLKGSNITFEDSLTNTGFRIINPNARQTCGCGTSFEA